MFSFQSNGSTRTLVKTWNATEYPNDLSCIWTIGRQGANIDIQFDHLNIEFDGSCRWDRNGQKKSIICFLGNMPYVLILKKACQ